MTIEPAKHAKATDLPEWPCPPRVRDIPHNENSWGWVMVITSQSSPPIAQDEMGYLWADGAVVPAFRLPHDAWDSPGVVLCWTEHGLGAWVHPKSSRHIGAISRLDVRRDPDRWVPIAVVLHELPAFVKAP